MQTGRLLTCQRRRNTLLSKKREMYHGIMRGSYAFKLHAGTMVSEIFSVTLFTPYSHVVYGGPKLSY